MQFKSIITIRPDKAIVICLYCPDASRAEEYAENCNYDILKEICPNCIDKFKMDSLKGTRWTAHTPSKKMRETPYLLPGEKEL